MSALLVILCVGIFVAAVLWYGVNLPERRATDRPNFGSSRRAWEDEYHPSPMQEDR